MENIEMFPGAIVAGPLDYNVNVGLLSMLASSWGTSPITCALGTEFGCRVAWYPARRKSAWYTLMGNRISSHRLKQSRHNYIIFITDHTLCVLRPIWNRELQQSL